MRTNDEDLKSYRMLKAVLNKGKFEIEGAATIQVALLFKWFYELEERLQEKDTVEKKMKIKKIGE